MTVDEHVITDGLQEIGVLDVLRWRGLIDAELRRRGVIRTGSSVAGEILEHLVVSAYGGQLTAAGAKSTDVVLPDGTRVQVKARWLDQGTTRQFAFGSLDFDLAVVALLDRSTYALRWAREIPLAELQRLLRPHSRGWRLPMATAAVAGVDITARLQKVYTAL